MKIHLKLSKPKILLPLIAVIILGSAALIGYSFLGNKNEANALSAQDFNAGNIISDAVFYNKDTMNVQQIQDFLNKLIPSCDTWGTNRSGYGNLNNAQYAQQIMGWHGAPYACLNNYHENPNTGETSFEKGGGWFEGGISAAQIIYNASQQYGINPQVLLTLLKKESAGPLTSDTWPLKSQYRYAMGYACPDSGPDNTANCNANQAGFYKQMMTAAWQLKYYKDNSNSYRYKIGWNDIQYSPDVSCGTKRVFIENVATLSLYIYTPYTPNNGALANYPGTAYCGAYGNRNFFMFFREWFGSTTGPAIIGDISKRYQAIGGINSILGVSLDKEWCDNQSCFQQFKNGYIIGSPKTGYWENNNLFRSRYGSLGYEKGSMGYPIGSQYSTINNGISQQYQHGYFIGSPKTGYWENKGLVRNRYGQLGYEHGKMGFPIGPEHSTVNSGFYQAYETGYIIGSPKTGYWENGNIVRKRYGDLKYEHGKMGFPIGPEVSLGNARSYQNFEGGSIICINADCWESTGEIRIKYLESGGHEGPLGFPIDSEKWVDGHWVQKYERGTITGVGGKYSILL
ncbi:hypothetical protein EOM27_01655 [Candidatus Saccharibacteria bacterium]|nr:hypothetical protein [Candidatus Saccharibacteria bacterium]